MYEVKSKAPSEEDVEQIMNEWLSAHKKSWATNLGFPIGHNLSALIYVSISCIQHA